MNVISRPVTIGILVGGFLLGLAVPAFAPCHVGSFVGAPYQVAEGAGKVVIIYSNGAGAQPGGTVDYRTSNGSATAPADYKATSGTLRWGAAGGTASAAAINPAYRSFEVPIHQDARDEKAETFRIVMSHFTGCFDASMSEKIAVVTIADDDNAPAPQQSTQSPSPQTSAPAKSSPTAHATPTPSARQTTAASPTPTPTPTSLAAPETGSDGGLSGGGLAAIVGGVIVVGGGAAVVVRRRFLS
jgi:hypothetical protein